MIEKESQKGLAFIQIFSGSGMGLLVGLIVGLSVSEVVSIILGALAALLAAFLGLQDQKASKQADADPTTMFNRNRMVGLRAGSFGFATVAAILLGIFLRTHDVLSNNLTLKEQVAVWKEAGYDKKDALQYVAYQNLKILPTSMEVKASTDVNPEDRASMGVLFSGEGTLNYCYDLSLQTNGSVENTLQAYRATKNDKFIELANHIQEHVPDTAKSYNILQGIGEILCKLQDGTNNIELYVQKEHQTTIKQTLKEAICDL